MRYPTDWYCARCKTIIHVDGDNRDINEHIRVVAVHLKTVHKETFDFAPITIGG